MVKVVGHTSNYPDRHFGADLIWRIKGFLTSHIKMGNMNFGNLNLGNLKLGNLKIYRGDGNSGWAAALVRRPQLTPARAQHPLNFTLCAIIVIVIIIIVIIVIISILVISWGVW